MSREGEAGFRPAVTDRARQYDRHAARWPGSEHETQAQSGAEIAAEIACRVERRDAR